MSILTLAVALFLTACSQQEKATQTSRQTDVNFITDYDVGSEEQKRRSVHRWQVIVDRTRKIRSSCGDGSKRRLRYKMLMEKKRPKRLVLIRSINPCVSGMSLIAIGSKEISCR